MATKLKNLKIKKVDFVDEGANPDAHIKMLKRKDEEGQSEGENSEKGTRNILKKLFGFIGKAAGMDQNEIESAMEEIQKGDSVSFKETFNEVKNRKIAEEIWDICYALQSSLCSILNDEELDSTNTSTTMQQSLEEFHKVVLDSIIQWSEGKAAGIVRKDVDLTVAELELMKSAVSRLSETIDKATDTNEEPNNNDNLKGDKEEMKIDKSKLTAAELAFLESIEKRCGVEEGGNLYEGISTVSAEQTPTESTVTKSTAQPTTEEKTAEQDSDNIYKGLSPLVAAELEELKKFRQAAEDRELSDIAKKYAIIGKKEEELVPLFKSLKAAGGTAYNDMIAVLDQAVATVEKSGAFSEIGKSGHGSSATGAVKAKVDTIAKGYMEKDPTMDYTTAVAKAWEDHPELMDEYEEEAGL